MRGGRHARSARPVHRSGHYRGRRRAGGSGPAGARKLVLVMVAISAVLTGTGALARTLPELPVLPVALPEPARLPQPGPPPPPEPGVPGPSGPSATIPPGSPAPPAATATAASPTGTATPAPTPTAGPTAVPTPGPSATATPTASPPEPSSYEAEAAELSGFVSIFPVPAASGGEVVGMIGRQSDNHVRFVEVTAAAAGEYEVTFHYVSAPPGEAEVVVNGGAPATVDFPGLGDAHTVGTVSVPVQLVAGQNEIWYGREQGPAPALDRITIDS